ncbi:MAG: hydroxymethylbilane synthase [Anaerolineae bacterium]
MHSSASHVISVLARGSKLSQAQVWEILNHLRQFHPAIHFAPQWVETRGDKDLETSLRSLSKDDFFTREIDELQLKGVCRISIHSAKDLPKPLVKGLRCVALTRGIDPSDSLVFRENESLETLVEKALIGTSSERRDEAVKALRQDLRCIDIRGSIDERLAKLDCYEIDGLVVAEAALIRLKLTDRSRIRLKAATAPLQGRLAVIAREDDEEMAALFSLIDGSDIDEQDFVFRNGPDAF